MITEAKKVGNPMLGYPFRFEVNDLPPFYITKCKIPNVEFEVVEVNGAGQTLSVKHIGGEKVNEGTLEGQMGDNPQVMAFFVAQRAKQRTRDATLYKFDATVTLLGPNDEPRNVWDIQGMWFSKPDEFDEFDADDKKKKALWKATFQCDDCIERPI